MTRLDAVGSGFLVALGIETIGQIFNFVGTVLGIGVLNSIYIIVPWVYIAGLVGGFIAGYRSASGLTTGCWHGLLAGASSGLGISVVLHAVQLVIRESVPLVIGVTVYLVVLITILGVIAGGIGGTVHRRWASAL